MDLSTGRGDDTIEISMVALDKVVTADRLLDVNQIFDNGGLIVSALRSVMWKRNP